jgi:glutathionyl-hydroquinone reductase
MTAADSGRFQRRPSGFRDCVSADGSTDYPAERGRYHLYASWACPWSHRTIIARRLKGLDGAVGLSSPDPVRDEAIGWAFTGGEHVDPVNGWSTLAEAYRATDPAYDGRVSSPVLWDTVRGRIVSNESADILRMFDSGFGDLADRAVSLRPAELVSEIDELNTIVYEGVNDRVYRVGFTTRQDVYEEESRELFAALDALDARLGRRRFLLGDVPVETDWRLFTTLVRFDAVYAVHFKCSLRRVIDYPNLWPYVRDLFQVPGIAETVRFDEIMRHYYLAHPAIDPTGIVPLLPDLDFTSPHGRERLSSK